MMMMRVEMKEEAVTSGFDDLTSIVCVCLYVADSIEKEFKEVAGLDLTVVLHARCHTQR